MSVLWRTPDDRWFYRSIRCKCSTFKRSTMLMQAAVSSPRLRWPKYEVCQCIQTIWRGKGLSNNRSLGLLSWNSFPYLSLKLSYLLYMPPDLFTVRATREIKFYKVCSWELNFFSNNVSVSCTMTAQLDYKYIT